MRHGGRSRPTRGEPLAVRRAEPAARARREPQPPDRDPLDALDRAALGAGLPAAPAPAGVTLPPHAARVGVAVFDITAWGAHAPSTSRSCPATWSGARSRPSRASAQE